MILIILLLLSAAAFAQQRFPFTTSQSAEVIAELDLSSPGSDWAIRGKEAAIAALRLDNRPPHHVVVFSGPVQSTYRVLLGALSPGEHELRIERDPQSAARSELHVEAVRFREIATSHPDHAIYANMPFLYARKNTLRRFSDVPLLAYGERLEEDGQKILQYTVVFSNEDGGTSTRALMARWGRATDIEYIYRAYLDKLGNVKRATVQGPQHKELDYTGKLENAHALLMPVTDNNMVAEATEGPLRFQPAPEIIVLDRFSREQVMDNAPLTYAVMSKELEREGKLRQFGAQAGERISDPRNYAYFEYRAEHRNSALTLAVHLKDGKSYSSDLGRLDLAISRDGWVRTTVELPPGSKPENIAAIELRCVVAPPPKNESFAHSGACQVDRVNKAFLLDSKYAPGPSFWRMESSVSIPSGQSVLFHP